MTWKIFSRHGNARDAINKVKIEKKHGARSYEFIIERKYVGRSADPAYSDKEGYQYLVMYRKKEA